MNISEDLLCVFSGHVEEQDGSYIIEIPAQEIAVGAVQRDSVYRVALLSTATTAGDARSPQQEQEQEQEGSDPPVAEGEQRTVDIEDIGEQGDGIARVERGYVVIVPETELNERVTIEITDVKETVAFGEVIDREDYYQ